MTQPEAHSQDDGVPPAGRPARTRPGQATFVSILLMLFGVAYGLGGVALLGTVTDAADHGESVDAGLYILPVVQIVLAVAQLASGVLVLAGTSWARSLAVVICAVSLLGGVVSLFTGNWLDAIGAIAVNAVLISMLNRDEVRDWCA